VLRGADGVGRLVCHGNIAVADLIREIGRAFNAGLARGPPEGEPAPGRRFARLFEATMSSRLPPDERELLGGWIQAQSVALTAARRGELQAARRSFSLIADERAVATPSRETHLLACALIEPAEAYLLYREDALEAARQRLLKATAADEELIVEHGYALLSAHRLQIALNLVRLEARGGAVERAIAITGDFLDYLELRSPSAAAHLASPRRYLDAVPVEIPSWYFDRFCGEAALALARHRNAGAEDFKPLAPHGRAERCANTEFGAHGHLWLRTHRAGLDGSMGDFWNGIITLLCRGPDWEPVLWEATVLAAAARCCELGDDGVQLRDQILAGIPDHAESLKASLRPGGT
jgi:hypothetical protein